MLPSLVVDSTSAVPPFEQVRAQLATAISAGSLVAGTKLPSVRALAQLLGLAPNTAARVYRELEMSGLVETRGRGGTVVTAAGLPGRERVRDAAANYAALARETGIGADEAIGMVRAALDSRRR